MFKHGFLSISSSRMNMWHPKFALWSTVTVLDDAYNMPWQAVNHSHIMLKKWRGISHESNYDEGIIIVVYVSPRHGQFHYKRMSSKHQILVLCQIWIEHLIPLLLEEHWWTRGTNLLARAWSRGSEKTEENNSSKRRYWNDSQEN